MFERILSVKYITLKNSFIYLPASFKYIKPGSCIQLTYGDNKVAYFSISTPRITLNDNNVGLNGHYAKTLGIQENELVTIAQINQLPVVNSITISPLNNDDFDMLEILAENIQTTLLDQIRVVHNGQKFAIWLGSNISVAVLLENVKPVSPGIIDFLTEVVVKPNTDKTKKDSLLSASKQNENDSVFDMEKFKSLRNSNQMKDENYLQMHYTSKLQLLCRMVPLKDVPVLDKLDKHYIVFNVFLSRKCIPKSWLINGRPVCCSMSLLTNDVFSEKIVYVKVCILEDYFDGNMLNLGDNLFVSDTIFETYKCHLGSRVLLKFIESKPFVNEINIYTKKNYLLNIEEKFKTYLAEHSEDIVVLNPDIVFKIGDNVMCSLKFSPVEAQFCVVDDELVRNCKYIVHEEALLANENKMIVNCDMFLESIGNYQSIIHNVISNFSITVSLWENVLITGKPGTGKSTLMKIITEKLMTYPNFIYVKTINCKSVKGKMLDSLFKVFSNAFSELILYQPSVLILDDLHVLCESVKGDEMAPNTIYYNRISEMVYNICKLFPKSNKIGICATAESTSKLNGNIYFSRGCHLFKNLYRVDDLTKVDRIHLLAYLFQKCDLADISWDNLSVKTEGFVVQDMVDFYNKSIFEAYKDGGEAEDKIVINSEHCESVLKKTCILALQNVQLHSPGGKSFSDIGGLHDIKKILIESLMWPVQYPNIFSNSPLRLQSGLLLYGPPGTGKTLLAAAAAKHCGLRLISIKGPELLSKYIGASEQAVRDVFQKAQSARPCILFFDEFDSLAPRRGHDNTGVTDRVVNQLLTQLDGVETLSGVCVLAATSRPDLLDPALLRPGRLDRQILCPLPDQSARLEILKVLSKNLNLSVDVNLEQIASSTEGYSGADLQSILYTAQLSTIDNLLTDFTNYPQNLNSQITMDHLRDALYKTRPSLPKQERMRYEKIYVKFQGGTSVGDFKAGSKATLA